MRDNQTVPMFSCWFHFMENEKTLCNAKLTIGIRLLSKLKLFVLLGVDLIWGFLFLQRFLFLQTPVIVINVVLLAPVIEIKISKIPNSVWRFKPNNCTDNKGIMSNQRNHKYHLSILRFGTVFLGTWLLMWYAQIRTFSFRQLF